MEVSRLESGEEEVFLELLDGWDVGDGQRGRDFFRRYVELDPTFEPENVWVARDGAELVSCVQIFPRRLQLLDGEIACGGIGTVFTRPDARRRGLAERCLRCAVDDMSGRGWASSVLFAARIGWYSRLGWHQVDRPWWRLGVDAGFPSPGPGDGVVVRDFVPHDLSAVRELHESAALKTHGGVVRDDTLWRAGLELAGNPDESFRVCERAGRLTAYLRHTRLDGRARATEWGASRGSTADAAHLFASELSGLADEAGGGSTLDVPAVDRDLAGLLAAHSIDIAIRTERSLMVRCLCRAQIESASGLPPRSGEDDNGYLVRCLSQRRLVFWPADRF